MDIVREKEFIELTAAERVELEDLCSSEEEYNQIKAMFVGLGAMNWSNPTPKAETKERLDHLFAQQYPKAAPIWYNAPLAVLVPKGKPAYRQPLVQVAAVGLLVLLAYPFVKSNMMTPDHEQVAALEKDMVSEEEVKKSEVEQNTTKDKAEIPSDPKTTGTAETMDYKAESRTEAPEANREVVGTYAWSQPSNAGLSRSVESVSSDLTTSFALVGEVEETTLEGLGDVASVPGSTHPDGIFIGDKTEIFSVPASREPAVFDLLTSTF